MKLSLAPIQGVTVSSYRHFYDALFGGIDAYYAPFISPTSQQELHPKFFDDVLPENTPPGMTLIPQLLGNAADHFNIYANHLVEMGYHHINWNIGCPFPTITRKKKGSGLLPHPDLIASFLDEVCTHSRFELSVKMRLGMTHVDEGLKVMEVLNDYPLSEVIVHARTADQHYTGSVDPTAFQQLYDASKHPIAYNGDIYHLSDYQAITARFPHVQHVMLGRGALMDPFLPKKIKGIHVANQDKLPLIAQFHQAMFDHYHAHTTAEYQLLNKMKEFWRYMHVHIDRDGSWVEAIRTCQSVKAYENLMANGLHQDAVWEE